MPYYHLMEFTKKSKDVYALQVLSYILGDFEDSGVNSSTKGTSSYILSKIGSPYIRKAKGFNLNYSDGGLFGFYLAGPTKCVGKGIKVVHKELQEISRNGVSENLFNKGKKKAIFGLLSSLETNVGLNEFILNNDNINFNEHIKNLTSLTNQDIQGVAKNLFNNDPSIVSYGNLEYVPSVLDL